jgi:hypothetical protein
LLRELPPLVVNPPNFGVAIELVWPLETTLQISYSYRELAMEPAGALGTTSSISYSYRELGGSSHKRANGKALVKALAPKIFAIAGICLLLIGLIEVLKFARDCPKSVSRALAKPPCVFYLHSATNSVAETISFATNDLETSPALSGGFSCRCY